MEEAVARGMIGAEAEGAGCEAQHQREHQADRAAAERPHARQERLQDEHRAGAEHRHRNEVADAAEQEDERARETLPYLAAVPAEVEDEREERGEGDQAEAQEVELVLLE